MADAPAIVFDRVSFAFDDHVVLHDVSFTIPKGGLRVLLGPSGSGKSILLKLALGLIRPDSGTISVNGHRITDMDEHALMGVRANVGMVFQENALFDSLTVEQNVGYRLYEETDTAEDVVARRVVDVLGFVGLDSFGDRMPSELSGGQRRRVGIARAMASAPELLLLDDPTTGLDPITATSVDDEIVKLRDLEQVTSVLATHQIRDAFYIATHRVRGPDRPVTVIPLGDGEDERATFMVLHDARIVFEGGARELLASHDPYLKEFLDRTLPPW